MARFSRLSFALGLFLIISTAVAVLTLRWNAVNTPLHFDPVLWNTTEWEKTPAATWGEPNHLTREVYYEGDSFQGKPTRIFAYYGCPEEKGPFPAVVLIHGGGRKAFQDWAEYWAKRDYVALNEFFAFRPVP